MPQSERGIVSLPERDISGERNFNLVPDTQLRLYLTGFRKRVSAVEIPRLLLPSEVARLPFNDPNFDVSFSIGDARRLYEALTLNNVITVHQSTRSEKRPRIFHDIEEATAVAATMFELRRTGFVKRQTIESLKAKLGRDPLSEMLEYPDRNTPIRIIEADEPARNANFNHLLAFEKKFPQSQEDHKLTMHRIINYAEELRIQRQPMPVPIRPITPPVEATKTANPNPEPTFPRREIMTPSTYLAKIGSEERQFAQDWGEQEVKDIREKIKHRDPLTFVSFRDVPIEIAKIVAAVKQVNDNTLQHDLEEVVENTTNLEFVRMTNLILELYKRVPNVGSLSDLVKLVEEKVKPK